MSSAPPVVAISGNSNSGKTTLIVKLIPALRARGYRIGTLKHAHHGFAMDREGKDTDRHRRAGADTVMVTGPDGIAMLKRAPNPSLSELLPFFADRDLVIAEGFKAETVAKIEIYRRDVHTAPCCLDDPGLAAVVTDAPLDVRVPVFGLEAIEEIADFIEATFLGRRQLPSGGI